ncbi:hypothetical protein LUR56_33015 [Streptomyces sp. MT29]|nr:hypothetical protein [Streptomyces sp. MT29]
MDKVLIVHCQAGLRGHTAALILNRHGHNVRNLSGCLHPPQGMQMGELPVREQLPIAGGSCPLAKRS